MERGGLLNLNKGSYYSRGKWISEDEYGKGWCYNEYYDDDFDLIATA